MSKQMTHWNETPLLRAGTDVISTPVKTTTERLGAGFMPRYNVANIHEIKEIWNVPTQA